MMDGPGNHTISINGKVAEWAGYGSFSKLHHNDHIFCGCTDFWDEAFPQVFMVTFADHHE